MEKEPKAWIKITPLEAVRFAGEALGSFVLERIGLGEKPVWPGVRSSDNSPLDEPVFCPNKVPAPEEPCPNRDVDPQELRNIIYLTPKSGGKPTWLMPEDNIGDPSDYLDL